MKKRKITVKKIIKKLFINTERCLYILEDLLFPNRRDKIIIYTAIFGGRDKLLEPKYKPSNCDFVCFTDTKFESKIWDVRVVEPINEDPFRAAKIYKILPHKYFPDYKYSVWVDGCISVRGNVNRLIRKYLNNANMAVFNHRQERGCVYKEAEVLLTMIKNGKPKDKPELIKKQIEKYKKEGYPRDNGMLIAMELVRRHNESDVVKTMKDWWREIENHSRRDQISFNYVAWKNNLNFNYIYKDSIENVYFKQLMHIK